MLKSNKPNLLSSFTPNMWSNEGLGSGVCVSVRLSELTCECVGVCWCVCSLTELTSKITLFKPQTRIRLIFTIDSLKPRL